MHTLQYILIPFREGNIDGEWLSDDVPGFTTVGHDVTITAGGADDDVGTIVVCSKCWDDDELCIVDTARVAAGAAGVWRPMELVIFGHNV